MKNKYQKTNAVSALILLSMWATAHAGAQDDAKGFVEGASLNMQNRLVYEQLDYKKGSGYRAINRVRNFDKAEESAYGLMLNFQSGYTRGLVGLGLDAHAYAGVNLGTDADSARGRYVATDGLGVKDNFGRIGAALKLRLSSTELKFGEMRTKNPIFHSSDSRLLPETNRGVLVTSNDIQGLNLQAGRFTKWTDRNARKNGNDLLANYSGKNGDSFSFLGGTWTTPVKGLSVTSYYGQYENNWDTWYLGGFYKIALANKDSLSFSLNLYNNTDAGEARSGQVDTTTWSLMSTYAFGAHKIGLGYQKVDGDNPFDYVNRGSIWLENAMQISDFNAPNEASWQIKYDVDLGQILTPGLSAGIAYTRGTGIDYSHMNSVYANYLGYKGTQGRHWERDMIVRYTVQQGMAKGLHLQMRHSVHRANKDQGEANVNQIRFTAEMPVNVF